MEGTRILILDDEPFASNLRGGLLRLEPTWLIVTRNTREAIHASTTDAYDVVLTDYNPQSAGTSSLDLCRVLRRSCSEASILVLSLCEEAADRIAAMNAGADDFVIKRFGICEIHARIQVAAARGPVTGRFLRWGPLSLDSEHRSALVAGTRLELSQHQWLLLERIARQRGEPVDAGELCVVARIQAGPGNKNLMNEIHRLRKRLDDAQAGAASLIVAVRSIGYSLRYPNEVERARAWKNAIALSPENEGCYESAFD